MRSTSRRAACDNRCQHSSSGSPFSTRKSRRARHIFSTRCALKHLLPNSQPHAHDRASCALQPCAYTLVRRPHRPQDSANRKSNQQNLGTIRCSNLCTEIVEYTSPDEVAVCNLASIALPRFVEDGVFNHEQLRKITYIVTRNLNRVIEHNYYPVEEARNSNMKHRPIGIGVQGLADAFSHMRLPFDSDGARKVNKEIFETIYFGALTCSCDLAKEEGAYASYEGSPVSKGVLQFDMWGVTPSDRWDWASLRQRIAQYGVRNSLLLAPMPTASTAQILGNNECFEPYTSNLYSRRVLAGKVAARAREDASRDPIRMRSVLA